MQQQRGGAGEKNSYGLICMQLAWTVDLRVHDNDHSETDGSLNILFTQSALIIRVATGQKTKNSTQSLQLCVLLKASI